MAAIIRCLVLQCMINFKELKGIILSSAVHKKIYLIINLYFMNIYAAEFLNK